MRNQTSQNLSKNTYLDLEVVQTFTHYLSALINGYPIDHTITIRDRKLPKNDPRLKNKSFVIDSLEAAFNGYWWDRAGYEQNALRLYEVQQIVRNAIKNIPLERTNTDVLHSLREVLKWGAGGTGQSLYTANEKWALERADSLYECLSMGCTEMSSETPNLEVFKPNSSSPYARMNAGFTKYYALACDDVIIYDGRVGAAIGLLAKNFCIKNQINHLPEALAFRWGAQKGNPPLNRNPSDGIYEFPKLPLEGQTWAEWNIKANWILSAAREQSHAPWCSGADGLRRIEAALFVVGYSMPSFE